MGFKTDAELALMSVEERNQYLEHWMDNVHDAVWVAGMQDVIEREYENRPLVDEFDVDPFSGSDED